MEVDVADDHVRRQDDIELQSAIIEEAIQLERSYSKIAVLTLSITMKKSTS
jgi:hypothetical protein